MAKIKLLLNECNEQIKMIETLLKGKDYKKLGISTKEFNKITLEFAKRMKEESETYNDFDGKLVVVGEKEVFVDEKQKEALKNVSKKDLLNIKLP